MVLSTGTLNLKFMQRAAARTAKAAPAGSAPASPAPASPAPAASTSTPAAVASPALQAPAPAPGTPAPATPAGASGDADDAEAKWVLPRRATGSPSAAGPSTSKTRVQFVASYLPFLEDDDNEPTAMAPGRMTFGVIEPEEKKEEGGGDDDDGEFEMDHSEDEVDVSRDKGKGRAEGVSARFGGGDLARTVSRVSRVEKTPEPEPMPATFQRPRGFSPERSGKAQPGAAGAGKKDKSKGGKGKEKTGKDSKSAVSSNLYSRLRDKLSIGSGSSPDNSPPSSAASTPGGSGKKRARSPELVSTEALKVGKKKKFGSGSDGLGGSLDERERRKKEAKKAEKKANKGLSKGRFFS